MTLTSAQPPSEATEATSHSDETEKYKPLQVFQMKTKWNDTRAAP